MILPPDRQKQEAYPILCWFGFVEDHIKKESYVPFAILTCHEDPQGFARLTAIGLIER